MGIEPTSPAWKTGALPLSYARSVPPGGTPRTPPGGVPQGRRGECTEAETRVNDGQSRPAPVKAVNGRSGDARLGPLPLRRRPRPRTPRDPVHPSLPEAAGPPRVIFRPPQHLPGASGPGAPEPVVLDYQRAFVDFLLAA